MIEQLRIRNLGVIRDAVLDFSPGLTVLTGETGTGKTMVFRSLNLLFGGKADASLISSGAKQALVEADVAVNAEVTKMCDDLGAEIEDGYLLIARQVNETGRSRSFAGGATVTSSAISDLGERLVAVHGQSDQLRLTKGDQQRLLLDRFAGPQVLDKLVAYRLLWDKRRDLEAALAQLKKDATNREFELDRLTRIFAAVDELRPQPDEDVLLDDEAKRLSNSEALRIAGLEADELLSGSDIGEESAVQKLSQARKVLDHERQHDSELGELADRIRELEVLVADIASDVTAYVSNIDASPDRLQVVESRRASLRTLAREFGDVNGLLAWVAENEPRLVQLQGGDEYLAELTATIAQVTADLTVQAEGLTKARIKAASNFAGKVSDELAGLAMPGARVEFRIEGTTLGPFGQDVITLGLVSRSDSPWVPLAKGASGGELSRIMLAVEVVLAEADPTDTFVFDEVDAGVGGAAAVEVGKRLAQLAQTSQVIVVTHLPQVAAFADKHLVVSRSADGSVSTSEVAAVTGEERVTELARMLAGLADSQAGTSLAQELLDVAEKARRHAKG